jgi:hypothetical protein
MSIVVLYIRKQPQAGELRRKWTLPVNREGIFGNFSLLPLAMEVGEDLAHSMLLMAQLTRRD